MSDRTPGKRRPVRPFRTLSLAMVLFTSLIAPVSVTPVAAAPTATIATDALNLRDGPGTNFRVLVVMYRGETASVLDGPSGGWYRLSYKGTTGWASGDFLTVSDADPGSPTGKATVTTSGLRLRAGPGTNYAILLSMSNGATVDLFGPPSGDWYKVRYSGTIGWASGSYLRIVSGSTALPAATATIATSVLNLRSTPNTTGVIVRRMLYGETVTVRARSGDWYKVTYHDGRTGWAYGPYLSFGGSSFSFKVGTHQQQHSLSCEYASLEIATAALGNEIPEDDFIPVVGQAANPHDGFRGDIDGAFIYGTDDYGVYPEALAAALPTFGFTGETFYGGTQRLKAHLAAKHPVLVWIDLGYSSSFLMDIEGQQVLMAPYSHVVVAYGYNDEGVLISDPDSSVRKRLIRWSDFTAMWQSMDQMALAVSR